MKNEIDITKKWIEQMVIGLRLCPFAQLPFSQNKIHYEVVTENEMEIQLLGFWKIIEKMEKSTPDYLSNSLIIYPNGLNDFFDYLDLYDLSEKLIADQNKSNEFQLASFHPEYIFDGVDENDVTNYTNRSPFPMIHILRVEEVESAILNFPNIENVPEENKKKLRELGRQGIEKIINP